MLGYLLTLVAGFWLGVSGFLYLGCYILEEILDLPQTMVSGIGNESASTAHTRLKRLVQRVIEEAMALPAMLDYSGIKGDTVATPKLPEFDAKTYEDLLATAILNKVIDRYQQDYERDRERSSGIHSESASPSSSHIDDEVDLNSNCLGKRALESGLGIDRSTPSPSSIEPLSRDGSINSGTSDRFIRRVNIANDIKLAQTEYSSDEEYLEENIYKSPLEGALASIDFSHKNRVPFPEYGGDIVDIEVSLESPYHQTKSEELLNEEYHLNGDIHTVNSTWEENWLFQKKRLKTNQSVPVPMLVPNSNKEYRAMIGDRDAEDTTDLSEAGSDEDENSLENDIKHVLVNSKTVIGGKNLGSLLDLEDDVINHNGEDILTVIVESEMKDPFDELNVNNKMKDYSQSVQASRTKPKEVVAMLVEIDSGPLTKAEFNVSEIHRGVANYETESIVNDDSLNISNNFQTSVQTEVIENQLISDTDDLNKNVSDHVDTYMEATNLDVIDFTINGNEQPNSLQQKESEYSETFAVPVQRHLDSLKRMTHDSSSNNSLPKASPRLRNADVLLGTNGISSENVPDTDHYNKDEVDAQQILELLPDSISVREKQKWLNTVPMPNNPYSTEAIEKRLSNKNSSIFDIISNGIPIEEESPKSENKTLSPPKKLQDVLVEELPEYKRYGRDYYIKEAKQSAGSRKKSPYLPHTDSKEIMGTTFRDSPVLILYDDELETNIPKIYTTDKPNEHYEDNTYDVYSARPIIIGTEETENEIINGTGYADETADSSYLDECQSGDIAMSESSDKENKKTNLNTPDTLSDSISSVEESTRIYNIQTGKVVTENSYNEKELHRATLEEVLDNQNVAATETTNDSEELEFMSMPKVRDIAKMFTKTVEPHTSKVQLRKKKLSIPEPEVEIINKNTSHIKAKQPIQMHSLTARSISKEFREELKLSMPTIQKIPGGANEVPEGMDEPAKEQNPPGHPVSPLPKPGTLKNKLAFFEKFNRR